MPAAAGRGHLPASHTGRGQVAGTLKAALVQGMLAKRSGRQLPPGQGARGGWL